MKKLFPTVCITFCLLFSSAAIAVRADGNGHAPGYTCVETATTSCPATNALPEQEGEGVPDSTDETAVDMTFILLQLVAALIR